MERVATKIEQGLAAARAGNLQRAKVAFESGLRLDPANFDALQLLGNVYLALKDFAKARVVLESALRLDPAFPPLLMNLGNCLSGQEDYEGALVLYDRALLARPGYEDALFNKGVVLNKLRRFSLARVCLEPLANKFPERVDLLIEYAKSLLGVAEHEAALETIDRVIALDPASAEAIDTRGTILAELGRYDEARGEYARATALRPDESRMAMHQSYLQVLFREFTPGWRGFERRFDAFAATTYATHPLIGVLRSARRWGRPEDFDNKRVLVAAEQGPGDNIMFASILSDLAARARSVDLALYPRLEALFARSFPSMKLQPWDALHDRKFLAAYDRVICVGSLAHAFRNADASFPGEPYLTLDPAKVAAWRARLGGGAKKKIGLSWRGGMPTTRMEYRSLALLEFAPLLARDDCDFFNLQHGDVAAEVAAFKARTGRDVVVFPAQETNDIDDLASLTGALDAVLTVQNTNVHVAGALGKPCFAILPAVPEWRYGASGDSMVWYKSVELFRRAAGAGIETVLAPLTARLSSLEIGPR